MLAYDLSGVNKPARLKRAATAALKLVETMREMGKPPASIALSRADYYEILEMVNKGREGLQPYTEIVAAGVQVRAA